MKLNKKILSSLLFLLVVSISGYAVFTVFKDDAVKSVKRYWELAAQGDLKAAAEWKSEMSSTSPFSSDGRAAAGNIVNHDGTIQDCCMGREIAEQQLKITKIIEAKEENHNALVAVETENKEQKSEIFVNCLSKCGGRWIVTGISKDIYEDRHTLCFDTGKPLRPKRFN